MNEKKKILFLFIFLISGVKCCLRYICNVEEREAPAFVATATSRGVRPRPIQPPIPFVTPSSPILSINPKEPHASISSPSFTASKKEKENKRPHSSSARLCPDLRLALPLPPASPCPPGHRHPSRLPLPPPPPMDHPLGRLHPPVREKTVPSRTRSVTPVLPGRPAPVGPSQVAAIRHPCPIPGRLCTPTAVGHHPDCFHPPSTGRRHLPISKHDPGAPPSHLAPAGPSPVATVCRPPAQSSATHLAAQPSSGEKKKKKRKRKEKHRKSMLAVPPHIFSS